MASLSTTTTTTTTTMASSSSRRRQRPPRTASLAALVVVVVVASLVASAFHSTTVVSVRGRRLPTPTPPTTGNGARASSAGAAGGGGAAPLGRMMMASLQTPTPAESTSSSSTNEGGAESSSPTTAAAAAATTTTTTAASQQHHASSQQQHVSHVLSIDEMNPLLKFDKNGKTKVMNAVGFQHLFVILATMPFWMTAMEVLHLLGDKIDDFDANRAKFDKSGKLWCRSYLGLTDCYPEIHGDVSRLRIHENEGEGDNDGEGDGRQKNYGACLYVANHSSFLDIAVLCCVLDPVFKFIAKDSLKEFPGVGRQLVGGEHLLIDRTDKRSQLRTFKRAITYLKSGVPIMAFPEGARSPDGRLMPFKGGAFSLAVKAGVPIVPLSLSNTHAVMPSAGFLPVQNGRGKLRVYVHDEIDVEGKSEGEIAEEVRAALLSELPLDQHPLVEDDGEVEASSS